MAEVCVVLRDEAGAVQANTTVYVWTTVAGTTAATLYSDRDRTTLTANPTTSDADGLLHFFSVDPTLWYTTAAQSTPLPLYVIGESPVAINVLDYGATGDGTTDDTAAIQAAIDACAAGGTVFIPEGTYMISSELTVNDGVSLSGAGWGAILKATASWTGANSVVQIAGGGGTSIGSALRDFAIDGNRANQTVSVSGVVASSGSSHSTLERLYVHDTYGQGISINGVGTRVVGCRLYNIRDNAIEAASSDGNVISEIAVIGCHIDTSDEGGIEFDEGTHDSIIEGNIVKSAGGIGIQAENGCYSIIIRGNMVYDCAIYAGDSSDLRTPTILAYDIVITNNHVEGSSTLYGIYATQVTNGLAITGNSVYNTGRHGIMVSTADYAVVANNLVRDCNTTAYVAGAGIAVDTSTHVTVMGNICRDTRSGGDRTQEYGIMVGSGEVLVIGNVCTNNKTAEISGYAYMSFGGNLASGVAGQMHFNTAAPASGTWSLGDIVFNRSPAGSGWAGWVCTAAGTPGTWKGFGAIEA